MEPLHSVGVVHIKSSTRVYPDSDPIPSQDCPELQEAHHFLDFIATDLV